MPLVFTFQTTTISSASSHRQTLQTLQPPTTPRWHIASAPWWRQARPLRTYSYAGPNSHCAWGGAACARPTVRASPHIGPHGPTPFPSSTRAFLLWRTAFSSSSAARPAHNHPASSPPPRQPSSSGTAGRLSHPGNLSSAAAIPSRTKTGPRAISCGGGSATSVQPRTWTSSQRSYLTFPLRSARFSYPRLAHTAAAPSQPFLPARNSSSATRISAPCCNGGSEPPWAAALPGVGVAWHSTLTATTVPHAPPLASSGHELRPSNARSPASAARPVPASRSTCRSRAWTSRSRSPTHARSKSSQTTCRSGTGLSWQSTWPSSAPLAAPDRCATRPTRTRARRSWQPPSASGNTPTPSFPARAAAT